MHFLKPFLVAFLFLVSLPSFASQTPMKFQQLSIEQGLSQSTVYSITQDDEGFVWLATQDGLNKFDGYEFTYYKNEINNPNSLLNNFVREVYVDSKNNLWVGTMGGLSLYNPTTNEFNNNFSLFKNTPIWSISENKDNALIITTADNIYIKKNNATTFSKINLREYQNTIKEVKIVFQDNAKNYWLGTFDNGLYILNDKMNFTFPLNGQNKWQLDIDAKGIFAIKDIDNDFWIATNNGIYVVSKTYELKKHITADKFGLSPMANKTRSLIKSSDNEILIGTENGLYYYNLNTETYQKKETTAFDSSSLKTKFIYSAFIDKSNTIWLGTIYNGAIKHNSTYSLFPHYLSDDIENRKNVQGFAELSNGQIWICTEFNGLYYFNNTNRTLVKSDINIDERLIAIFPSDKNNLWLLTYDNQILLFNIKNNTIERKPSFHLNNILDKQATRMHFIYSDNAIWFGSNNSTLHKYSPSVDSVTSFEINKNAETFYAISATDNGDIFINSDKGELLKFSKKSQIFSKVDIPQNELLQKFKYRSIKETRDHIWFEFLDKGILLYNKVSQKYYHFNETTGLKNNVIGKLLLDDTGNAWISSNKGLSKLNPYNKTILNYDTSYGLQSEEFITGSALESSQGKLFFGGVNGFNVFFPQDIKHLSDKVLKPVLTNLRVANKIIKVAQSTTKNFTLPSQLFSLKQITLKYNQSPFTIEFASPNAGLPKQVQYRYKLVDIDDEWIETGASNRRATYTNLSAGLYQMLIEAYEPAINKYIPANTLSIKILPPWWKTNIAWFIYGLSVLLVIYYFIRQAKNREQTNIQIKASEERLKLALWGSGDEMWDWNMQTNQMYRSNIWGTLDFPTDSNRNNTSENSDDTDNNTQNIHPQDYQRVKQALEDHKTNKTEHYEAAYRVRDKEGTWVWVLDRGKVVERDNDDMPVRMTGTLKDISQIKQTEESLKLFAKCIENISDAVVVYDSQFKIVDCNLSFQRITGQTRSEALRQELAFNSYPASFLQNLKKNLVHHGSWQGEIESKRTNGETYLIDITLDIIRDENEKISHFVGVFSDITIRKETEAELRKLANSDTLTGLPNRSFFQANHSQLVAQDVEHALMVFDLDNFKKINDSLGHQIGDVLLCKVTERIATVGNIKDTCYRLGGDEFSLIIEGTNDIHNITSIADEVLNAIAEPYFIRNQEIALSCSIGIVLFPDDGDNSHELLKNADTAMYHAKDKGGDTYQFFNDSMNKQAVKRLQIENLIRHGLKEDLFSVYYQPKIEVKTGKIKGMEALVRFEAGQKGIIRPDIFIPISEETGQIIEIGEVVLKKACLATKAWLDNGMFKGRIAVNLSAVQFRQPNLVQIINEILEETKLPAEHLELEITEGTVMDSPTEAIETMLQIRKMGIHLSLDDFGTGYSSLAYLKKFPLNTLKIDKAFVDDIETSEAGRNMVATIVTIAHNLGMEVVAEGVEYEKQLNYLKSIDCEQLQGYLYSRPLSEEDFGRYLLSHIITDKSTIYTDI